MICELHAATGERTNERSRPNPARSGAPFPAVPADGGPKASDLMDAEREGHTRRMSLMHSLYFDAQYI